MFLDTYTHTHAFAHTQRVFRNRYNAEAVPYPRHLFDIYHLSYSRAVNINDSLSVMTDRRRNRRRGMRSRYASWGAEEGERQGRENARVGDLGINEARPPTRGEITLLFAR